MHKKEKTDAQRAKIFTKIGREISVAVKEGGADPAVNEKLKMLISKAKQNNVPNDNIDRVIKKAAGAGNEDTFESITYEGYGPCGVAVIVETLTDNRNRTAGDLRHYFDKYGGNLGQAGSVAWMFETKGVIVIEKGDSDADSVMLEVLDAGAIDFTDDDEVYMVYTDRTDVNAISEKLRDKGFVIASAQAEQIPSNYVTVEGDDNIKLMSKLLEMLEDNDDVQNVWHNIFNDEIFE